MAVSDSVAHLLYWTHRLWVMWQLLFLECLQCPLEYLLPIGANKLNGEMEIPVRKVTYLDSTMLQ